MCNKPPEADEPNREGFIPELTDLLDVEEDADEQEEGEAGESEPRPWYRKMCHKTAIRYLIAIAAVLGPVATLVSSCA
jgi:hypothetical protein